MANIITMNGRFIDPSLAPEWAQDDYLGAALRAGIDFDWLGPCKDCPLLEVCAADDCGRLGFSVSVNDSVKYGYVNRYK